MSNSTFFELARDSVASRLRQAVRHTISTLEATPEDKLDYRPTETAKSVRKLAQHILHGNNMVLGALGLPADANAEAADPAKLSAELGRTGEVIAEFAASRDEAGLEQTVEFFGRPIPTLTLLMISEWHISRHAGQIDYLQTTWDDQEDRFF